MVLAITAAVGSALVGTAPLCKVANHKRLAIVCKYIPQCHATFRIILAMLVEPLFVVFTSGHINCYSMS